MAGLKQLRSRSWAERRQTGLAIRSLEGDDIQIELKKSLKCSDLGVAPSRHPEAEIIHLHTMQASSPTRPVGNTLKALSVR